MRDVTLYPATHACPAHMLSATVDCLAIVPIFVRNTASGRQPVDRTAAVSCTHVGVV